MSAFLATLTAPTEGDVMHLNCDPPDEADVGDTWTDPACGQRFRAVRVPGTFGQQVDWELVN